MFDPKTIDNIASRLSDTIPPGLNAFREEMEKNMHAVLQNALGKLDLVTREEFEVQKAVLAKTRQKLDALSEQIARMEEEKQPQE